MGEVEGMAGGSSETTLETGVVVEDIITVVKGLTGMIKLGLEVGVRTVVVDLVLRIQGRKGYLHSLEIHKSIW